MNGKSQITAVVATGAILISLFTVGCGDKKSGGGSAAGMQCDMYGNCYPTGGNYNPYNNMNPYGNPNAIIQEGRLNVTDRSSWYDTMESFGLCATRDQCGWLPSTNPIINVVINDYKLNGDSKSSSGMATVGADYFARSFPVLWRAANGDSMLETSFQINNGRKGRTLTIRLITGSATTSSAYGAELYLDGKMFANGNTMRVNKPVSQPAQPTPYGKTNTNPYNTNLQQYPYGYGYGYGQQSNYGYPNGNPNTQYGMYGQYPRMR